MIEDDYLCLTNFTTMTTPADFSQKLNRLLATYQIHYQNLRAIHWNIKGEHFFRIAREVRGIVHPRAGNRRRPR